jgi:hypothetical protein
MYFHNQVLYKTHFSSIYTIIIINFYKLSIFHKNINHKTDLDFSKIKIISMISLLQNKIITNNSNHTKNYEIDIDLHEVNI